MVETWTSLYDALWPQGLARSGIVAGFAASVAARSPLITRLRDDGVAEHEPGGDPPARHAHARRARAAGSIRTPVYLFQGRTDFAFDLSQATRAYARLAGPKRLYVGTFGHAPSTFPGPDVAYVLAEGRAWFDRFLKGKRTGVDAAPRVTRGGAERPPAELRGAAGPRRAAAFVARRGARPSAATPSSPAARRPLRAPLESWGGGTAAVTLSRVVRYPRLVVTVLAGDRVVAQGGLKPRPGVNLVRLANYCVYVPRGTRLRVTVGPASPAGQFAYLGFAGSGSATIGAVTLTLSTLRAPVSG